MNCAEARLRVGAEPHATSPALEEHLLACAPCARFRGEMRRLEADIGRALAGSPGTSARPARAFAWTRWALAATVLIALSGVLGVWLLHPSDTLAHELTLHVQAEPDSWLSREHLDAHDINGALKSEGVALELTSEQIVYAHSCFFRGHWVPHLVLQTAAGPATIIILRHEHVGGRRSFREDGMEGILVPAPTGGSYAVLTRRGSGSELLAQQMQQDVRWLPPAR